ncbi:MAG: phytanoyl-CoA dioxygenase family protein [Actinomycetota bacterium]
MALTDDQRDRFAEDGFLVIPGFIPPEQLASLRDRAAQLDAEHRDDGDGVTVFSTTDQSHADDRWFLESGDKVRGFYEDDGRQLNKLGHAMHDLDPVFDDFCRATGMAAVAADIGIEDPRLVQSMYIFKHPSVGGEVTWHTDHTFLWTEPRSVVGFWVAIDEATTENGCMWAIPGGHRIPVKSRFVRDGDQTSTEVFDATPYPIDQAIALPADPGTLILLDGALPHWSDANRSDHPRQAFTLHVVDGTAHWDERNWLRRSADMPFRSFADTAG